MQPYLSVFDSTKLKAFLHILGPSGLFLGMRSGSKKIFYLVCRQSTLVLEVCVFFLPHLRHLLLFFGLFGAIFYPSGLFLGLGSGSKTFFEPNYEYYQLWFSKYSPIFLFFNSVKIWGLFCTFWLFRGQFWGWNQVQKPFWEPTYID